VIPASHFQLALLEMERRSVSPRAGRESGPARPPGRGEVPDRRRVVPAPRSYSTNLRIHEDERASERTSERDVFCSRELFLHPPVVGGRRKGSLSISKEHVD